MEKYLVIIFDNERNKRNEKQYYTRNSEICCEIRDLNFFLRFEIYLMERTVNPLIF